MCGLHGHARVRTVPPGSSMPLASKSYGPVAPGQTTPQLIVKHDLFWKEKVTARDFIRSLRSLTSRGLSLPMPNLPCDDVTRRVRAMCEPRERHAGRWVVGLLVRRHGRVRA